MGNSKIKVTLRSLFIAYLLSGILLVVLALLMYQFRLGENMVGLAVNGIYILTCFLGGLFMGKGIPNRRFFWGFLLGALYFAVLAAASVGMGKGLSGDMGQLLRTFIMCAASGTIGGMVS